MQMVYTGKGTGKTTELLAWVLGGESVEGYPGWDRVLLVPSIERAEQLKPMALLIANERRTDEERSEGPPELVFGDLDYSHRVYGVEEWARASNVREDTEIAIDGIDQVWGLVNILRLPGELVRYSLDEAEAWEPEGMSMKGLREHAVAHDERYQRIRDAVKLLKDEPHSQAAVEEAIAVAADYDWSHPGNEVLGPAHEESSGVAPYGAQLSKEDLTTLLQWLIDRIEADDSMEGSFAYELALSQDGDPGDYWVQAALRHGNSMGQGSLRLVRKDLSDAKA
jgi:hypothetical protein